MNVFSNTISALTARILPPDPGREVTPAQARALMRLFRKRDANLKIPDTTVYTRQQARADGRAIAKEQRSLRKRFAMEKKRHGGAAGVR